MKIKLAFVFLLVGFLSLTPSKAVLITNFSESEFEVIEDFTTLSIDRYPTYLLASGSAFGGTFAGTFDSVDTAGFSAIRLTGRVGDEVPDMSFTIHLYDTTLSNYRVYQGYTDDFGLDSTSVTLTFVEETAFFTDIGAVQFTAGGTFGSEIAFAFESLEAIPEPSVYALSAVALGAAAWLRRRRKG